MEVVIKSPSLPGDSNGTGSRLTLPEGCTLRDVKLRLQQTFPGSPAPESITIIHAGRVLKQDDAPLSSSVMPSVDPSNPPTLHIVIKPSAASSAPSRPAVAAQPPAAAASVPHPASPARPAASSDASQPAASAWQQAAGPPLAESAPVSSSAAAPLPAPAAPHNPPANAAAAPSPPPQAASSSDSPQGVAPFAFAAGMPPIGTGATLPLQAAYGYAPYPAGSPGFAIYYPALAAGYAAALATMQQHSPGAAADVGVPATAAAAAAAAAQQQAAAALALMPMLLAQPVLVPSVQPLGGEGAAQQQQQQQQHGQLQWAVPLAPAPWGGAQLYPQLHPHPLYQPLGAPAAAAHLHVGVGGHAQPPVAQLRQRRRGQLPEQVAALLRQQEQQLGQLPPPFAALLRRHEAAAGRRDLRAAGGGGRLPAGFQFRLRINVRALLQLLVLLVILYQHCPPRRFLMLVGLGLLLYLTATEPVRRLLHRLTGMHQQPRPAPPPQQPAPAQGAQQEQAGAGGAPGAAQAEGAAGPGPAAPPPGAVLAAAQPGQPGPGAGAPGQQQPQQQGGGLLQEIRAFVVGFITSLLPGYNVNPEDAAAFAAAQEMMAAEADAARGQ